ncbi:hypothetical protein HY29_13245 [Hyphomonas beringensis]|uniref:SnoaL-like domain-containing protein n=1 Tax=Hyphomonas beringensis TaxID=1280946 RepID=A0A062UAM0_9PROT|nr:nuclear transport factor 2 family protein [Hyphomonas beringensis]KCZ54758.1 hypothetical protein HY29_13245 [Hyphomonas beringensis]
MEQVERESLDVAMEMVTAWNELDVDGIVNSFAPEGELHSMMKDPIVGRDALRAHMGALLNSATRLELQLKTVAVKGNTVILERVDDFDVNGKHGSVPVVGVLVIEDGHVAEWREYYDRNQLLSEMGMPTSADDQLIGIVEDIIASWKRKDIDGVLSHVADNVQYHYRVGSRPLNGPDELRAFLEKFGAGMHDINWKIFRHSQTGNLLMVEGADDFVDADGNRVRTPYMGVFEFEGDKVVGWRDYFNPEIGEKSRTGETLPPYVEELLNQ